MGIEVDAELTLDSVLPKLMQVEQRQRGPDRPDRSNETALLAKPSFTFRRGPNPTSGSRGPPPRRDERSGRRPDDRRSDDRRPSFPPPHDRRSSYPRFNERQYRPRNPHEERDFGDGTCLYCHKPGHWAGECGKKKADMEAAAARRRPGGTPPTPRHQQYSAIAFTAMAQPSTEPKLSFSADGRTIYVSTEPPPPEFVTPFAAAIPFSCAAPPEPAAFSAQAPPTPGDTCRFVLDTGASRHMTPLKSALTNLRPVERRRSPRAAFSPACHPLLSPSVERRRSPRAAFSPACHPLLSPSPLIAFPNRAPAHAPVCARSPKCPVLHAPLPGAALVSDPSSLLRTSRVVSPRPFSPRVLLCRVARTLPALPSKPCPPPALHSFCRSSTHPVTPLTPTGYGPQPLPLRLSPAPFPRSPRNPWPQHRAPPFLRASPTRNSAQIPPPKGPATIPPRPSEKKTRALPAPQHHPLPHAHAPPSFALHALQRTSPLPRGAPPPSSAPLASP